ncbi:hypothetical protein [Paracoccus sp. (in: a-proteobacteria)]|uniref:hypothetical protein n=1 Tax=Paracoccus sp. TaxID=267 RepID=UPI002AFF57DA|nr:hypothetical protein [Paracoccus sp. (in: a-proteobacteria)]
MKLEATEILRSLITEIRMLPEASNPGGHEIELVGELAGILNLSEADMAKPPRLARAGKSVESETMVAGLAATDTHIHWQCLFESRCKNIGTTPRYQVEISHGPPNTNDWLYSAIPPPITAFALYGTENDRLYALADLT